MAEYIEKETMRGIIRDEESKHQLKGCAWIEMAMDRQPSADVVPVVRCKDCKYRSGLNGKAPFMFYICTCAEGLAGEVRENNFCSYGERKEGTDNG